MSETASEAAPEPRKIPEDIKTLADACAVHFRGTNRLWMFSASLSLAVIGAGTGSIQIAGTEIRPELFFPLAAIILALVNLAFGAEYLQAHRAHEIFIANLKRLNADETNFAGQYKLADAAHALYASSLVRLNPFSHFLPNSLGNRIKHIKLAIDWIFYAVPIVGCFLAAGLGGLFSGFGWPGEIVITGWIRWPFAVLFLVTLSASALLAAVGFRYWRGGYGTD